MAKLRFHIRYPEEKIPEPILYEIGQEYKVIPSIRRADVRETTGWMDVEFSGETLMKLTAPLKAFAKKDVLSIPSN